jgi:hypothetical protein
MRQVHNVDKSHIAVDFYRALITAVCNYFHARDGAWLEIGKHRIPVVGWSISKVKPDTHLGGNPTCGVVSPKSGRWTMKQIAKDFIETTQTAKTSCQTNFTHGHPRLMNELLGKEHASGLCYSNRGGAEMLFE